MKALNRVCTAMILSSSFFAATAAMNIVEGTVKKVDSGARTVVVTTAEGTEHTIRLVGRTTVHGVETASKDSWHGLKEGSEVVAHCTLKSGEETAMEIDKVGKDGLKAMEGTVVRVDKGAKTVAVKGADGAEEVFRSTDHAAVAIGAGTASGIEKSAKVTVYYSEESGKKVAHFFRTL